MRQSIFALVAFSILMAALAATAQVQVQYSCAAPSTGSPCAHYNWYVCWPDSNTLTLAATTTGNLATVTHVNAGESVRVEGVDAQNRVGPRSVASVPWNPAADTTGTIPPPRRATVAATGGGTTSPPVPAPRLLPSTPTPSTPPRRSPSISPSRRASPSISTTSRAGACAR